MHGLAGSHDVARRFGEPESRATPSRIRTAGLAGAVTRLFIFGAS